MEDQNLENIENPAQKTPSPEQSVDSPTGSSEISKPKPWVKVGAIVTIVVLLVGAVGYLVYQNYQLKKQSTPEPTPSQQPTQPPTQPATDETAGWNTYINEKYGFSFKHPNLNDSCCSIAGPFSGDPKSVIALADMPSDFDPSKQGSGRPFDGLQIYVMANVEGTAFEKYMQQEKAALEEFYYMFTFIERTTEPLLLDNQTGVKLQGYDAGHGIDRIYVPFPNNQSILAVSKTDVLLTSFDETFNQILSTFKFLD